VGRWAFYTTTHDTGWGDFWALLPPTGTRLPEVQGLILPHHSRSVVPSLQAISVEYPPLTLDILAFMGD